MENNLSTKRKMVFALGIFPRALDDAAKAEQWKACNNLVISWILNNVSKPISTSILYVTSASVVWKHLEQRFSLSNGARKYKLNKDLYALRQNTNSISEYYTQSIWEKLDAMCDLPKISGVSEEVTNFFASTSQTKGRAETISVS